MKRKAAAGSRDAYSQLLDMMANKVPGAREALVEVHDELIKEEEGGADRDAFWAEVRSVEELLDANGPSGLVPGDLRQRASRLGPCEQAQAAALEAYRLRLLGDLQGSQRLLADAWEIGRDCAVKSDQNPCHLELGRRRAILLAAREDYEGGLRLIEPALEGYRQLGEPGHDLTGDGVAACLAVRGKLRFFAGDALSASGDLAACLQRTKPGSPVFIRRQRDLAMALLETGPDGREEAYQLLRKPRLALRNLPPRCVDRAFFDWLDGQLELGREDTKNRNRGSDKMLSAIGIFAERRMPDELLASSAHYIKFLRRRRDSRDAIKAFVMTLRPIVEGADGTPPLVTAPEHRRRLNAILRQCQGPPTEGTWALLEQAIEDLRFYVTGPHLLPCLAP